MRTGLYFRNFLGLGPNIPMFVRPQIIVREKPVSCRTQNQPFPSQNEDIPTRDKSQEPEIGKAGAPRPRFSAGAAGNAAN